MIPLDSQRASSPSPNAGHDDRRRSRRRPLPGVFVALETPEVSEEFCWAGNAIDINGNGLGLALPPEVREGSHVLLSFHLGSAAFDRVPAVVLRHDRSFGIGAVCFGSWPEDERLSLLTYLLEH